MIRHINQSTLKQSILKQSHVKKLTPFTKSLIVMLTFSVALVGCNNNSTDTTAKVDNTTESSNSGNNADNKSVEKKSNDDVLSALQTNLKASGIEQTFTSAVPTDMPDIYWVTGDGTPAFYTDKEGKYVIQGQIVEVGGDHPVDISSDLVAKSAKEKLAAVDKDELIIYPAQGETKAVIYSFTDADCPYCTKLHSEMEEINKLGIEVRYLAWPRSEKSIPKMESIWCSDDKVDAMNKAKSGEIITASSCKNPVISHMKLGMNLGVSGTPAIFTESGIQIGGYLPAKQLAKAAIDNS